MSYKPPFEILSIPVERFTKRDFLEWWSTDHEHIHHIVTINAEMFVAAMKNPHFYEILQKYSINIPDSISIIWAGHFLNKHFSSKFSCVLYALWSLIRIPFSQKTIHDVFPERLSGADLYWDIIGLSGIRKDPIYLLGAGDGVAKEVRTITTEKVPNAKIVGAESGGNPFEQAEMLVHNINQSRATVLLTAYGAPKQELWIHKYAPHCPELRYAIGLGGTFDFIAEAKDINGHYTAKRAPEFIRDIGLEWLWRLITQPHRFKRIKTAVIDFPLIIIRSKLND